MSEKVAALFLIILSVAVAGVLMGTIVLTFFPDSLKTITEGATNFITEGFKRSTITG